MRRLSRLFSSQERRKHIPTATADAGSQEQTMNSTAMGKLDDSWTSIESSEIFTGSANWLDEKWTTSVEFASDPTAWELQLDMTWSKLQEMFKKKNDNDMIAKVHEHLSTICKLLVMEVNSQSEPSIGPILDQFFNEEILLQVQKWAVKIPQKHIQRCQMMLLSIYENMVCSFQSPQSLLVHKPILIPLLLLLQWCRKTTNERLGIQKIPKYLATTIDKHFVRLIKEICRKIAEDETLLHFFFHSFVTTPRSGSEDEGSENEHQKKAEEDEHKPFLIFDLLVPYLYAPDEVGQQARDSLLLILSASQMHKFVADYVIQKSDFCHVLAGGLSACFSQLPKCIFSKLGLDQEEAHKLNASDIQLLPQLYEFHNALIFCNAVAQTAHDDILRQITQFIYTGFLLKVFKTSFLESEPKNDELCSLIVYFHHCIDTISSPALLQVFIKVLLVPDKEDDLNLLEFLLLKMQDNEKLCRVTLSFVRTLIDLHCEDILWCTVFRYLLPFITLKGKTQNRRFNAEISLNAANFFIKCIPDCVKHVLDLCSEEQFECYLREAREALYHCELSCTNWKLPYNGQMPTSFIQNLYSNSDELLSARQPFTRHSSARSSFASTGWNRYGTNRSGHGTLLDGSLDTMTNLNELGEDEEILPEKELLEQLDAGNFSSQEDFCDTNVELSADSHLDYFHFAYEGISESDPDSCSRRNSEEETHEEQSNGFHCDRNQQQLDGFSTITAEVPLSNREIPAPIKSNSAMRTSVFKTDWTEIKNREHFIELLINVLPTQPTDRSKRTVEENIALIESRWQYIEELRKEKTESIEKSKIEPNPFRLNLNDSDTIKDAKKMSGFPMIATDQKGAGILLESLFDVLSRMPKYNFATNMQLIGVLNSLMAYPQPLLTTYLLYVDLLRSKTLIRITDIMSDVKTEIDKYASNNGPEEFDKFLNRGLRHRLARAGISERKQNKAHVDSTSTKNRIGGFFTATAATITDGQATSNNCQEEQRISNGRNNFVYAAIVFSQLCQMMAAFALQHSPANLHHNMSRDIRNMDK